MKYYGYNQRQIPHHRVWGYIIFCRVCKIDFMPQPHDVYRRYLHLCYECKKKYHKQRYRNYYVEYLNSLPPERAEIVKKSRKKAWENWVKKHPDRRRQQARASYHRHKSDVNREKQAVS